jgi:hypothetical protein
VNRDFIQRDGTVLGMMLRILLHVIAQSLPELWAGVTQVDKAALPIGAVACIHRFGYSLNLLVQFYFCVIDAGFEEVPGDHWTTRNRPLVAVGSRCQGATSPWHARLQYCVC